MSSAFVSSSSNRIACYKKEIDEIERIQEGRALWAHRTDSLLILVYVALLIVSILTIWAFKHKRLRFLHESGVAIILGVIIGAVFRYAIDYGPGTHQTVDMPNFSGVNESCGSQLPPDTLILRIAALPDSAAATVSPTTTKSTSSQTSSLPKMNISSTTASTLVLSSETREKKNTLHYKYKFQKQIKNIKQVNAHLGDKATFDPEIFFNILLPPIIFFAGYNMKRKHFFENFGTITLFAFLGTILSTFSVGGITFAFSRLDPFLRQFFSFSDCLMFGALISATDPVTVLAIFSDLNVDVTLYALVFGESVLNDAVAIVLTGSIDKYASSIDSSAIFSAIGNFLAIFAGSFGIGCAIGIVAALITKFTHIRNFPLLEISLFVLMSYASFLAAEAVNFTGIVAILFCGVMQAQYTSKNLSATTNYAAKQFFEVLNFLSENFIFTYIGVSAFTFRQHSWSPVFIVSSLIAVLIGRAINIYGLSALLNLGRSRRISAAHQHMLMFSGLRGAMAYALAIRNTSSEVRQVFFTTTLVIVIATVVFSGGFVSPMLDWLKIRKGLDPNYSESNAPSPLHVFGDNKSKLTHPIMNDQEFGFGDQTSVDQLCDSRLHDQQKAKLVRLWLRFDSNFLTPLLTHHGPLLADTLPQCCLSIAKLLTTSEQMLNVANSNAHANSGEGAAANHGDQPMEMHLPQPASPQPSGPITTNGGLIGGITSSGAANPVTSVLPPPSHSSHAAQDSNFILEDEHDESMMQGVDRPELRFYPPEDAKMRSGDSFGYSRLSTTGSSETMRF